MSADFSSLLDTLLVVAGLVLIATGLVIFIYSKTSTQESVEAFGIKLNVTHPSLILVLAGVGLMLAPRLLPEPPGKADRPESTAGAEVATQKTPPSPAAPETVPPRVPQVAAPSTPPASATAAAPPVPAKPLRPQPIAAPSVSAARPARTAQAARQAIPVPKVSRPVAAIASIAPSAPAASKPAEPVARVAVAAEPARATLAYAALGLPIGRSFWSGETRASYTRRIDATLQQAAREVLRMDARSLELGQSEFDTWWDEPGPHPRSRALCSAGPAPLALLAARVETPTTISSVESAYWPELELRLFVCDTQKLYRQQKSLSPQNRDAWPFSTELGSEIERFMRTYRVDLSD